MSARAGTPPAGDELYGTSPAQQGRPRGGRRAVPATRAYLTLADLERRAAAVRATGTWSLAIGRCPAGTPPAQAHLLFYTREEGVAYARGYRAALQEGAGRLQALARGYRAALPYRAPYSGSGAAPHPLPLVFLPPEREADAGVVPPDS
ncbi:MAG: hypothetical protein NVSMB65_16930 [Chloroflexota bacterium]